MPRQSLALVMIRLVLCCLLLLATLPAVRAQGDPDAFDGEHTPGRVDLSEFDEASTVPGPVTEADSADSEAALLEFAETSAHALPSARDETDNDLSGQPAEFGEHSTTAGAVTEEADELPHASPAASSVFLPIVTAPRSAATHAAVPTNAATGTAETAADQRSFADFNGDGFDDLAVGVPYEDIGTIEDAGAVNVIYGSAAGLTTTGDQVWHQDVAGIVGGAEASDYFGISVTAGDFDGDAFADLAIAALGEDVGTIANAGAVHVLYGSAGGLSEVDDQVWHQDVAGIGGVAENSDIFGVSVATGDFDHDGFADLAIGASLEAIGTIEDAGTVNVIYGSAAGLTATGDQVWHQDVAGIGGVAEAGDQFGAAVTAGDFDHDGFADLAAGISFEDVGTIGDAGAVHVLYGSAAGLSEAGDQVWHQDSPGLGGVAEAADRFGAAVTTGDFDNNGIDDLAAGVPFEAVGTIGEAGAVHVLYGSASGLSEAGDQVWHQDVAGIVGAAEVYDRFGSAVTAGDFDNDGVDDLAAGIPYEAVGTIEGAGAVHVLYGSTGFGLSEAGDQAWHQDSPGIEGGAEYADGFGTAVTAGDFDNNGADDLAVGVPYEAISALEGAGVVHVLYGSGNVGLTEAGDQLWHQDSPGIGGATEANDLFGNAVN